jgi:DnaA family protein
MGLKQLPLPLGAAAQGRFETYLPGPNRALVAQLAAECPPRAPLYLWGPAGSGKTHLLQALAQACTRQGGAVVGWFDPDRPLPWVYDESWPMLVFDDVERFDPARQQAAFALCVHAQSQGRTWAASGTVPPVDLPLRDDLRTRLGWGQVHALLPLDEEETLAALGYEAERRGITLSADVMRYLLTRFARDLASLMRLLDRIDAYSLARGRAVTLPLLREMLAEDPAGSSGVARSDDAQDRGHAA